jgi:acetone carboxylase, alpha subunit
LVACRETAKNVSASPIVEEIEEVCFNLYTPDGDAVVISTGIITHVLTMGYGIKWMIRNDYEDDPGIREGDIFQNNDTAIGNVHTPDVHTYVPIFHEGELVAWAGCCVHVMDIGATVPGSIPVGPINRFGDGMYFSCERVGENDKLYKYYETRVGWGCRTPTFWHLDDRMRVTACHMIRERLAELIDEIGIDVLKAFLRESVEDGRRAFLNRVRERLIPGDYEDVSFSDLAFKTENQLPLQAQYDSILHLPIRLTVEASGLLNIDYREASPWGLHTLNASPTAVQGGYFALVSQTLMPGEKINSGQFLGTNQVFDPGSILDPQNPHAAHGYAWYSFASMLGGLMRSFSQGYFSRGYREEIFSYAFTYNMMQGGGLDRSGDISALFNFDFSCTGMGAQPFRDGLLAGHAMWNPLIDMGEVETWELSEPLLYLSRRVKPMTGGAGKFRGGNGFEALRMLAGTDDYLLQFIGPGLVFDSMGLFGGYPASVGYAKRVHETNMRELIAAGKPYPIADSDPVNSEIDSMVDGTVVTEMKGLTLPEPYRDGDLYLNVVRGGPGYGDPLERDPAAVCEDVQTDEILERFAESLYGVILTREEGRTGATWTVDVEATAAKRKAIRKARLARATKTREWIKAERERVAEKDFVEPVKRMYAEVMQSSESFAGRFRSFWDLPSDYAIDDLPRVIKAY